MSETDVVNMVVAFLLRRGFTVATEVANFHRSADIAAINVSGEIWIIECKLRSIGKALEQLLTHKESADKVFVATLPGKTRATTIEKLSKNEIGLMHVCGGGEVGIVSACNRTTKPWGIANDKLRGRIRECKIDETYLPL